MGSLINHFPGSSETSPSDRNGMAASQFAVSIIGKLLPMNMTLLCMFCGVWGQHELDCGKFRLGYKRDPSHSKTG